MYIVNKMNSINCISYYLLFILTSTTATIESIDENGDKMLTKLDCQEGESRSFKYSSETNLWGSVEEQIAVSALVDVDCMGRDNDTGALKYMVHIKNVKTDIKRDGKVIDLGHRSEIGKIVRRREKRSEVSDWVANSWEKIKAFFTRFLRKSLEKQLEDKLELDLEGRGCSVTNTKDGKTPGSPSIERPKRSATSNPPAVNQLLDEKIELPFEFVQLPGGSIPEIRLSKQETNEAVKNFKKHIVDTFATQLIKGKQSSVEQSPIGEHISHYEYHEVDPDQPIEETLSIAGYPSFSMNRKSKEMADEDKKMQVIREISRSDVIKVGSGSVLIHDPDQVNISIRQVQEIVKGRMTETAGLITVDLTRPVDQSESRRRKRNSDDADLDGYMKVFTAYSMNSSPNQRSKRDVEERMIKLRKAESDLDLVSEPLVATSSPEQDNQDKLARLQGLITQIALSQQSLDFSKGATKNPDFDLLIDALQIESKLKLGDVDSNSLSTIIRYTINRAKLDENCGTGHELNLTKCHDLLVIATIAGSPAAIQVLTESFSTDQSSTSSILSRIEHPSDDLITSLVKQFTKVTTTTNESIRGSMLMTISSLAYKSDNHSLKKSIGKLLSKELEASVKIKCDSLLTLDILEAIGNLGEESFVPRLIDLANDQCSSSESSTIGIVHALRQMVSQPQVIDFLTSRLKNTSVDCSIRKEIIYTFFSSKLIVTNGAQENRQSQQQFKFLHPMISHSGISELSESILSSNDPGDVCVKEELKRILRIEQSARRKRRSVNQSFWDDSSCTDHTSTSSPKAPIPKSPESPMVSDGNKMALKRAESTSGYIQRRKCSASKSFGPKQVQAVLRADIINDVLDESDNPDYKLTANFGLSSFVLGKNVDVGKMYLYAKRNISRAYVSLFGQTLLDSQRESCDNKPFEPYRYTAYVPLYDFNVWVVRLGLGLRFNGELAFDHSKSSCLFRNNANNNKDVKKRSSARQIEIEDELLIKPGAQLRVAGETSGTILLLRGGIDIGGDFNYQSDLQFKPKPGFCLSAYNAHRPMNVSVQPWFQFWDTSCQEWSNRHIYRPETLNWQVAASRSSPWFENECIIRK